MAEFDAAAFGATLGRAFSENGIGGMLSFDRVKTLTAMTERLLTENEKYNLTALTDPGKIALLHYADCALIAKYMKKGRRSSTSAAAPGSRPFRLRCCARIYGSSPWIRPRKRWHMSARRRASSGLTMWRV